MNYFDLLGFVESRLMAFVHKANKPNLRGSRFDQACQPQLIGRRRFAD
jgi:hypothetical protein